MANLKALEFQEKGSFAFNVGTGVPTTFNYAIEILNGALGAKVPTEYFDNPYSFYQDQTQADTSYADKALRFRCQFTPEAGIRDYAKILGSGLDLTPQASDPGSKWHP